MMQYPNAKVLIFGKSPIPGQVKTRLIPSISPEQAAQVYQKLFEYTLSQTTAPERWHTELWLTPDTTHPYCQTLAKQYNLSMRLQQGAHLGQILSYAIQHTLKDYERIVLVGTDCPVLTTNHIETAIQHLENGANTVVSPTEDGGFALLALNQYHPDLFKNIRWSTDSVCSQLLVNVEQLGFSVEILETLWDIDEPRDLARLLKMDS